MANNAVIKLYPSEAAIWTNCPGSTRMIKTQTGSPEAAARGIRIHEVLSYFFKTDSEKKSAAKLSDMGASEEEIDVADSIYDSITELKLTSLFNEFRVELNTGFYQIVGNIDFWGLRGENNTELVLIDVKTGYLPVQVDDNRQLMCYLYLLKNYIDLTSIKSVLLIVYQPFDFKNKVKKLIYEQKAISNVLKFFDDRLSMLTVCNQRYAGEYCKFCKSNLYCPEYHAELKFYVDIGVRVPGPGSPNVEIPDAELATWYKELLRVQKYVNYMIMSYSARIMDTLKTTPEKLPGLLLEEGPGRRSWDTSIEELQVLEKMFNVRLTRAVPVNISEISETSPVFPMLKFSKSPGALKIAFFDPESIKKQFEKK